MAVTLQQIAEAAGVSRGTVDRAMNNRGRINPEVAERIRLIAKKMGYQPNRAGRALAMSGRSLTIGVIIQVAGTPFMEKVLEGILQAKEEAERLGANVLIRKIPDMSAEKVIAEIEELRKGGCDGIALMPVDDRRLRETVDSLAEEHIPVVTFNTDIEDSARICFVGQDAMQSGRAAAGLMAEIMPFGGKVLVISGYLSNHSNKSRTKGFVEELSASREDIDILDVQYAFDDDRIAGMIAEEMVKEYSDLGGIYLTASGVEGVCESLERCGLSGKVRVISNDLTDQNIRFLKEGKIRFLLGQDAHKQGYEPVMLLFNKLFDGKDPEKEFMYTEIVIKTKYNL